MSDVNNDGIPDDLEGMGQGMNQGIGPGMGDGMFDNGMRDPFGNSMPGFGRRRRGLRVTGDSPVAVKIGAAIFTIIVLVFIIVVATKVF